MTEKPLTAESITATVADAEDQIRRVSEELRARERGEAERLRRVNADAEASLWASLMRER